MIRTAVCSKCLNRLTRKVSRPTKRILNHEHFMVSVFGINLSKEEIWKCPVKQFGGNIHIVASPKDLERKKIRSALKKISSSTVVGFDTETAVVYPRRNCHPHLIGLVQIATESDVILWRLRRKKKYVWENFPQPLKNILNSNKITKVGNGTYDDLKHLYETYGISVSNMVDNQTIATDIGYNKIGLVALAAQLFGWRINKREQLSNWELPELSESQLRYASTDAWVSLKIYQELSRMASALGVRKDENSCSSFEHILRQEAKFDADFLFSLDFFNGKMHTKTNGLNDSIVKRQKPRLSFDARDYDMSWIPREDDGTYKFEGFDEKNWKKDKDAPFIYQSM